MFRVYRSRSIYIEYVRHVPDLEILGQSGDDFFGKLAHNLGRVDAADVAVDALPLGDPGAARVGHGDEALEDGRRARLDGLLGALEVQVLFAVGAPFFLKALFFWFVFLVSIAK